jgi:serine/threonine-protein kinase
MNAAGFAPPDAFGPFRTVHQVGEGALGPVFRADDSARERIVAVKVFKLGLSPDRQQQLVAGLDRIVALALPHPVIVPSIAAGSDGVITYVVREFVSGSSLDVVLREQRSLRRARALQVIRSGRRPGPCGGGWRRSGRCIRAIS